MTVLEILLVLILAPIGTCAVVCSIGWWATASHRLGHQERMFELGEKAKVNAIVVQERQAQMLDRWTGSS